MIKVKVRVSLILTKQALKNTEGTQEMWKNEIALAFARRRICKKSEVAVQLNFDGVDTMFHCCSALVAAPDVRDFPLVFLSDVLALLCYKCGVSVSSSGVRREDYTFSDPTYFDI